MQHFNEEWIFTYDHDPRYQISNYGRIKGVNGKLKNTNVNKENGYCYFLMVYDNKKTKNYRVNRIVMYYFSENQDLMADYFFDDNYLVDHWDNNKLNNHISNLRWGTYSQNAGNRPNTKGYWWNKKRNAFQGEISIEGKKIYLGLFKNETDAKEAYNLASIKYFKDFSPYYKKPVIKKKPIIKKLCTNECN